MEEGGKKEEDRREDFWMHVVYVMKGKAFLEQAKKEVEQMILGD